MEQKITVWYDVETPMRDGVVLRANVYGPADDRPYPAILLRFPYLKDSFEYKWGRLNPLPLARAGYRVVVQDCRGTGASQGEMDFDGPCQARDGYDTVEWIAAQPWCDGGVGMYGLSYYGFTQLLTAEAQPPHLKAICPWQQTGLYKYSGGFTTGSLHLMWLLERARDRLYSPEAAWSEDQREMLCRTVEGYLGKFGQVVAYVPEGENPAAKIEGLPFLEDYLRRIREYDDPACPAREGRPIDRALATVSRGPGSYTGEDTAEIQCHGSPAVLGLGLEALFARGVRQAGPGVDFADLLRRLNAVPGDFWLRFMASHPKDASPRLFDAMAQCDKVAKQLHLPFQSGSDEVLRRMNRRYTAAEYRALVADARTKMPDITLSSDIIVGFPGETEQDFEQTLQLVEDVKFDLLFTFLYSPRTGTPAASYEDNATPQDKQRRFERLLKVQDEIVASRQAAYQGKTLRLLVDGTAKGPDYPFTARTEGNLLVCVRGEGFEIGSFIEAKIEKTSLRCLFAHKL